VPQPPDDTPSTARRSTEGLPSPRISYPSWEAEDFFFDSSAKTQSQNISFQNLIFEKGTLRRCIRNPLRCALIGGFPSLIFKFSALCNLLSYPQQTFDRFFPPLCYSLFSVSSI
jgi:hypothetical protein